MLTHTYSLLQKTHMIDPIISDDHSDLEERLSGFDHGVVFYSDLLLCEEPSSVGARLRDTVPILNQPFVIYEVNGALDSTKRCVVEAHLTLFRAAYAQRSLSRLELTIKGRSHSRTTYYC